MSLTASMWTSVSGLLVHGEKMNVIGNNISNVNTVGFKASRMDFEDFISQYVGTAAGMGQVGRGTSIGIVMKDFSQGSFETTTDTTDIAIAGNGFFKVKPRNDNTQFYTRAGNFRFDKDGFLCDPHGYVLQGWKIDNTAVTLAANTGTVATSNNMIRGSGTPVDVRLDTFSCNPRHTTNMTLALNLDSAIGNDKNINASFPFFALQQSWNATPDANGNIKPLGTQNYAHPQTIEVFDEAGQSHKLTIYFDRVQDSSSQALTNDIQSEIKWEFLVTMDPETDLRDFDNDGTPEMLGTKRAGQLMSGTLTFDSSGQLKDMTAFVPTSSDSFLDEPAGAGKGLSSWVPAPISADGFPLICPNFTGKLNASVPWASGTSGPINPEASGKLIELNFGLRSKSPNWDAASAATAAAVGTDVSKTYGFGVSADRLSTTSTSLTNNTGTNFFERFASQDGYTYGELRYVTVSRDGILSAAYSNGVSLELYQITLYDFPSKQNLRREGGNLFTETRESGLPTSGGAGTGSFGTTQSNSLEQSNVDLSREFVQMIATQRGFQANSKTITTVDTMLDTVINMKR